MIRHHRTFPNKAASGRLFLHSCFLVAALYGAAAAIGAPSGAGVPDLTRPPEPRELTSLVHAGRLADFRNALGDALASRWRPSQSGRPGSCSEETFARWVDLYQWLDLLESDEASVTKRWLSHHLSTDSEKSGPMEKIRVTIHQTGSPLVRRYDRLQHQVTEQVAGDPLMLQRVMGELVAQPFQSRNGPLIERLDPGFIAATLTDPDFLRRWSSSFGEGDFQPRVLLDLQSIWRANPADWQEFQNLALAIALVLDQPAPADWPHHQVSRADLPRIKPFAAEVFSRWVTAFRSGKLRSDPRQMEERELKFVVDAPLAPGDFDYIRNSPTLSREDPARAFASIVYDRGRVAKNLYSWPWGAYRLSRIREHGGICVDQAYYAAISGKALGIPTIFFAGQGKDGGHAWIGYLKGGHQWDLNVGRYADQNYASGEGLDPQNWTPINDHDIGLLTRHLGTRDPQDSARRDVVMAWNFRRRNDAPAEGRALLSARISCPENPIFWDAQEDWLVRTASPAAEIKSHHEAAIRQFGGFRDLKAQHQEALVRLELMSGNSAAADHLSSRIVQENRVGRSDISASAASRLISSRMTAGDPEGALLEYGRQLRLQGGTGGGDFFYKVTVPLASEFLSKGRADLARRVLKNSHEALKPKKGSLVDLDFRRLWKESGSEP